MSITYRLKKKFQFEDQHQKTVSDIFGLSGDANTWITLKLTLRAYLLLREDYPLSIPYTEKKDDTNYTFYGPVANFEGIGRYVLGLLDEIEIESLVHFKQFIQQKIESQKLIKMN